jgi:hypothetical protein
MLGEDLSLGPLPAFSVPTFSVDPNLLLLGGGLLMVAFFLRGARSRVQSYTRKRSSRRKARRALKEQLRSL